MVEGVHAPVSIRGLLSARLPPALVDDTHRRRRACKRPLPHYLREGGPRDYGYTDLNLRAEANFSGLRRSRRHQWSLQRIDSAYRRELARIPGVSVRRGARSAKSPLCRILRLGVARLRYHLSGVRCPGDQSERVDLGDLLKLDEIVLLVARQPTDNPFVGKELSYISARYRQM
jgi:hypothetical protein